MICPKKILWVLVDNPFRMMGEGVGKREAGRLYGVQWSRQEMVVVEWAGAGGGGEGDKQRISVFSEVAL